MTTKSKVAPATPKARTRRKSVSKSIQLTPSMIRAHSREQGWKEYHAFVGNLTDAEMRVVGHLTPLTFDTPQDVVKEAAVCSVNPLRSAKSFLSQPPTQTKLDRHIVEILESLAQPQGAELKAVPNHEQGGMNHENTAHEGLINESSESELKRKTEDGFDDTIH